MKEKSNFFPQFLKFFCLFINLKREREILLIPKYCKQLGLGQAKTKGWELDPCHPHG